MQKPNPMPNESIPGGGRLFPCGQTRREFVWEMGAGFAGLALSTLLGSDGFFDRRARAADLAANLNPLAPKPPHAKVPAKACIFLMMNGGPSHVDTFDYKPTLAKYAGQPLPKDKQFTNSGNRKMGYLTPAWRPFARRRWFRRLEARVLRELAAQRSFAIQISSGLR